jgi:hypothetical protein
MANLTPLRGIIKVGLARRGTERQFWPQPGFVSNAGTR